MGIQATDKPARIGGSTLLAFACVLRIRDRGDLVTVRGLMREMGFRTVNAVANHLAILEAWGWIRRDRYTAGSIVPLCRLTLFTKPQPTGVTA